MRKVLLDVRPAYARLARMGIPQPSRQAGPVVYCALEGQRGFRCRKEAFRIEKLAKIPEADPPFFLMETPLSLAADQEQLIDDIRRQVRATTPAAICLDTLNRSIAGSESDDEQPWGPTSELPTRSTRLSVVSSSSSITADMRPDALAAHSSLAGQPSTVQISIKRDAAGNIDAEVRARQGRRNRPAVRLTPQLPSRSVSMRTVTRSRHASSKRSRASRLKPSRMRPAVCRRLHRPPCEPFALRSRKLASNPQRQTISRRVYPSSPSSNGSAMHTRAGYPTPPSREPVKPHSSAPTMRSSPESTWAHGGDYRWPTR